MKVEFLDQFYRDLARLSDTKARKSLLAAIEKLEKAPDLTGLTSIKKLKGHDAAYRIRLGDYRLGFFLSGQTIE